MVREFWLRFRRNRAAVFGVLTLAALSLFSLFAIAFSRYGPFELAADPFKPPSLQHPFGTDDLGRDIFVQSAYGLAITLMVGAATAVLGGLIGIIVGSVSGYFRGALANATTAIIEIFQSLPLFFLVLVIISFFGSSITNTILALGLTLWASTARIQRGQVMTVKNLTFVEMSKLVGEKEYNILIREILPNSVQPSIVNIAYTASIAIVVESGLAFLGLGDPRMMSLGFIIGNARLFFFQAWWMGLLPGILLFLTILSLNLVSDGLNEVLNPRRS
ncbi:MAG: ABC transporter permease [Candidatus Caldarchaeum sp.]|nr:ABC transporter permease [Candidatus Caldarchaeum sp.]MCS7137755.1 ABC transporter permease [Candidatus Caldarchaeum sp.]MDW7977512.1 ABC transporter permease [Candidatus Caldarchaeum sp.]MDW8359054.1 ABC transporter permease [Candidatus Caldarchaeum sp.]